MDSIKIFSAMMIVLFSGCSTSNRFEIYYGDYGEGSYIEKASIKNPVLIETFDMKGKVAFYENSGYVILGVSSFDGEWEPRTKAIDLGKKIGASIIITQSKHTGNIAHEYSISVPTTTTAQHSGTIRNSYNYGNSFTYSGTTTIHGSEQIQRSYTTGQYEQEAVFMAKKGEK